MKKVLFTVVVFFIGYSSYGQQAQAQKTEVNIESTYVELAEKRAPSIEITSDNKLNLDDVKGFVLVGIKAVKEGIWGLGTARKNQIRDALEFSPFEIIHKKKDIKKVGLKTGYIYVTYNEKHIDNNNFTANWVFRNHKKRTVFSCSVVNKTVEEVLNEIGISSY